ncbi:MAG: hemoglobin [Methylophagaceae bacterium]|jgi:hemoglobin
MTDIHTGMKITEKDFNYLVDLLIDAMNIQCIPHRIQNQLLARLVPLRASIIYI